MCRCRLLSHRTHHRQEGADGGNVRVFRDWCSATVPSLALAVALAGGIYAGTASARPLPQNGGPGASGQAQQQNGPNNDPQTQGRPQHGRPQPGQPQQPGQPPRHPISQPGRPQPGQPTIQPVPGPRPTPGPGYRPGPPPPRPLPPPGVRPLPPYYFRPGDRARMQHYYHRNFGYINRGRRPVFFIGGYIPITDRRYFTPVPPHMVM